MALFQSFSRVLDPVLNPLLKLPSLWVVVVLALIAATIIALAQKIMTDQHLMKTLKQEIKDMQNQVKALSHDPVKAMGIQKAMMSKNMEMMMQTFKASFLSLIPIALIFGWLSAHLAFMPIMPGIAFSTTVEFLPDTEGQIELVTPEELTVISGRTVDLENSKAVWTLKGPEGDYDLTYKYKDRTYIKPVKITKNQEYIEPIKRVEDTYVKTISVDNKPLKPLNLFGWELGWLGTYIVVSIIASMVIRKILGVH